MHYSQENDFDSIILGLLLFFFKYIFIYIHWPFLLQLFELVDSVFGTNSSMIWKNDRSIAKERFWCNPKKKKNGNQAAAAALFFTQFEHLTDSPIQLHHLIWLDYYLSNNLRSKMWIIISFLKVCLFFLVQLIHKLGLPWSYHLIS